MQGGGNENTLAIDPNTGIIYKSNNLYNSKFLISNLLNSITIHNKLFPETRYEVVGFTGIDPVPNRTPHIEVIIKQEYVPNAIQASPSEIQIFMVNIGFAEINEITYTNGKYIVSDLHPRNVLRDENGFIHVIDNIISFK